MKNQHHQRLWAAGTIVFITGFAVMVLEIIGARLLARDFGGSFYVWVSQIGVVLAALALGYLCGGMLGDRLGRTSYLSFGLILSGLVTVFIPALAPPLIRQITDRHPPNVDIPLVWQKLDPALGSLVVFFIPCLILAAAPPYMIRLASVKLAHVGTVTGLIYGANTTGSIAGVFVSGYILIDYLRLSQIFQLTGVLIVIVGVACRFLDRWPAEPREERMTEKGESGG